MSKVEFTPVDPIHYEVTLHLNGTRYHRTVDYDEYLSIIRLLERISHFRISDDTIELDPETAKKIMLYLLLLQYVRPFDLQHIILKLNPVEIDFWYQTFEKAMQENRVARTISAFLLIYQE